MARDLDLRVHILTITLSSACNDVIQLSVIKPRRHFGGTLNANKGYVKMRKSVIFMPINVIRRLCVSTVGIIPRPTVSIVYASLRCYTAAGTDLQHGCCA